MGNRASLAIAAKYPCHNQCNNHSFLIHGIYKITIREVDAIDSF
jgi:hypothetical protein